MAVSSEIFVLGAGFTRAFLPAAPLMVDDYNSSSLLEKFKDFPTVRRILEVKMHANQNGQINIERLMTRLQTGMPYDFEMQTQAEFGLLFSSLKERFLDRLAKAKEQTIHSQELAAFAKYCVLHSATCISFNYDDVLDQALWKVKELTEIPAKGTLYWHPDGGYGFFCRPSICCVMDTDVRMDKTSMHLFKLHGSSNWYPKFGYPEPYTTEALLHHEAWLSLSPFTTEDNESYDFKVIENHLAKEPFMVPPVLFKSDMIRQPVIRLVWHLAYKALSEAKRVTFIGYSLPLTDIATGFLFGEALKDLPALAIRIVNLLFDDASKNTLIKAYQKVLPQVTESQFDFRDALEWANELTTTIVEKSQSDSQDTKPPK